MAADTELQETIAYAEEVSERAAATCDAATRMLSNIREQAVTTPPKAPPLILGPQHHECPRCNGRGIVPSTWPDQGYATGVGLTCQEVDGVEQDNRETITYADEVSARAATTCDAANRMRSNFREQAVTTPPKAPPLIPFPKLPPLIPPDTLARMSPAQKQG